MPKLIAFSKEGNAYFTESGKTIAFRAQTASLIEVPAQVAASAICMQRYWNIDKEFKDFSLLTEYVKQKSGDLAKNGFFIP